MLLLRFQAALSPFRQVIPNWKVKNWTCLYFLNQMYREEISENWYNSYLILLNTKNAFREDLFKCFPVNEKDLNPGVLRTAQSFNEKL